MPSDKEIEAAAKAFRRAEERPSWGIKPYHEFMAKAMLEAAEKVQEEEARKYIEERKACTKCVEGNTYTHSYTCPKHEIVSVLVRIDK